VDADAHFVAITLHLIPIFSYFRLLRGQFIPRDGGLFGRHFHHLDAIFHWANIEAQTAAHAIVLTHNHPWPHRDRVNSSVRRWIISCWRNHASLLIDQVYALVRRVVAGHVTQVTANTFLLVDARNHFERKIEILKV
jgi:hypothetical protein